MTTTKNDTGDIKYKNIPTTYNKTKKGHIKTIGSRISKTQIGKPHNFHT